MRILLTDATHIFAGGEDYVLILAKHLQLRGHDVTVSALPGHLLLSKCRTEGISTLPIDYQGMDRVFAVAKKLRRELQDRKIDIIHSNANYDRTVAAIAAAWTHVRHVAGVHSSHSIQHNLTHWVRNRWGIDHFVTDAEAGKQVLVEEDHIPPRRVTVVPIGIEAEAPAIRSVARRATRSRLGIADSTVVVGNVARLVPFKGHQVLLNAARSAVREVPDLLFLIIGDGELEASLREQAQTLGINDKIRFLGFQDDLHQWYPAFDIYCHSSLDMAEEMFPIAILRALAAGLPVVCSDVGGIGMMVRHESTGLLVHPGDPDRLSHGLLRVVRDPVERQRMGAGSAALFDEQYRATVMAERMECIYRNVMEIK
jgi:glycosyltransferase involved in cell wall biosynthesis